MATASPDSEFAQHPPPPGGYSVDYFRRQVDAMARELGRMRTADDPRAVFQTTYLAFSRHVLAALEAGTFHDQAWATDMCCRFVEIYHEQLRRWERRHGDQCRAWQVAFGTAAAGRGNVLQGMFLGMNAHIHYDLAFVTLGACRHAGDLGIGPAATRALEASRSGVPLVRYRDFLVINRVAWESIPLIQDEVLRTFSRWLYLANQPVRKVTHLTGQRILLEARDASWCQTALLVHARDEGQRRIVARAIDLYAGAVADAVGTLTLNPVRLVRSTTAWLRRGQSFPPDVLSGLVEIACDNPVAAALALHQLAVMGADPLVVVAELLQRDGHRLAAAFTEEVLTYAPRHRRRQLHRLLHGDSAAAVAVVEAQLEQGMPLSHPPPRAPLLALAARWSDVARRTRSSGALPDVAHDEVLTVAIADYLGGLAQRIAQLPIALPAGREEPVDEGGGSDVGFLLDHPDDWVRLCARQALGTSGIEREQMARLIERVLFLKETQLFVEVEAPVLLRVAERLRPRSFETGALVVAGGEPTAGLHLLRSGEVEVLQRRDGPHLRVAVLGPHDAVGELSVLNDTPATADCRAITPVETFFLPRDVLAHLLHEQPRLAIGVIRMLSQRLISTTERLQGSTTRHGRD